MLGEGGCVISILYILTGGGGVKNPKNQADVICTWPPNMTWEEEVR